MTRENSKVCHLSSAHNWFDERILQKECRSLAKAGYNVVFVVPHTNEENIFDVRIVPLPQSDSRFRRFTFRLPRILAYAMSEKADIYHFHDPELIIVGCLLKAFGKKVIYDVHEDYEQTILSRNWLLKPLRKLVAFMFNILEQITALVFDHIIVADSNIKSKFPSQKTTLITNVPPSCFADIRLQKKETRVFKLIFIGSLSASRGVRQMIESLHLIKHNDVELHLIGELVEADLGPLLTSSSRVIHHGRIPFEKAQSVRVKADVGLLLYQPNPVHLHFTGEGNTKLFEYMAANLAVIYSDFPKLRQLLQPIGCGLPVDPTDPVEIAAAIDRLYNAPQLIEQMGENGRQAVLERFNWEYEEKKLLDLYINGFRS